MPTAKAIFQTVAVMLTDADYTRWSLPELTIWLNDGIRATLLAKPSACTIRTIVELDAGTVQTIPDEPATATDPTPLMLLGIDRNVRDVGPPIEYGRNVTPARKEELDNIDPNWHDPRRVRSRKEVRHFVYDELEPSRYQVYPPNDGTGLVELILSGLPVPVAATGDVDTIDSYEVDIGLPALYETPLVDYLLFRCWAKDDAEADAARSQTAFQAFAAAVGLKIQSEAQSTPNRRRVT